MSTWALLVNAVELLVLHEVRAESGSLPVPREFSKLVRQLRALNIESSIQRAMDTQAVILGRNIICVMYSSSLIFLKMAGPE